MRVRDVMTAKPIIVDPVTPMPPQEWQGVSGRDPPQSRRFHRRWRGNRVHSDISERKRVETQLQRQREVLNTNENLTALGTMAPSRVRWRRPWRG